MAVYQFVSSIVPKSVANRYAELLRYNDIKIDADRFLGFIILFGAGASFAAAFDIILLLSLPPSTVMPLFLGAYAFIEALVYAWLVLAADSKGRFVDSILPDALRMMATNIRAGMTTDKALLLAARPEFGVLEREFSKAGKQVLAGKDIRYALLEVPKRIKSENLQRTVRLVAEGIESGGELAGLLEQAAQDIQSTRLVQEEMQANVAMYAMFIFMAAGIGAPVLFGVSTYLVDVLGRQFAAFRVDETVTSTLAIRQGAIHVAPDFLVMFVVLALAITAVFAGMIMGVVRRGAASQGLRYIPVLLALSLAVFFGVRAFVSGIFAGV